MAFFYSKRKLRVREGTRAGELNIVPYLDILMNLIMFMLLSITGLAAFGILNVNAPNYGGPSAQMTEEGDKPKLLLTVLISKKGFYVAATGGVLGQQQGQSNPDGGAADHPQEADGTYDYAALTEPMVNVKKEFPSEIEGHHRRRGRHPVRGAGADHGRDPRDARPDRKLLFPDVTLGAM